MKYIVKNNTRILVFFLFCFLVHSFFSIYLGYLKGWSGDEWFSYRDFTLMALPFAILTKLQILFIGPISNHNFIYYKTQGLIWLAILFIFLFSVYYKSKKIDEKYFILYTLLFLTINPFTIELTQFFRYYTFTLLFSFLVYFLIRVKDYRFNNNRKIFYSFLAISPFIHFSIFLQLSSFIFLNELLILIKKNKWFTTLFITTFIALAIFNIDYIFIYFYQKLMPLYSSHLSIDNIIHRGYGLRTLIKPINSLFVFLFGPEIAPLENMFLNIIFIISGFSIIYILTRKIKENSKVITSLFFSCIIPFFSIYFILEPLSLPGTVQPEPKHGLFVLPWLIFILFKLNKYNIGKLINIFLFTSFLYSDYLMIVKKYPNWNEVEKIIGSGSYPVISDVPADVKFNLTKNNIIIGLQDTTKIINALNNNDTICLVMKSWSNYQVLTMEQKWNSAKGTSDIFLKLEQLFKNLGKDKFHLIDGYSRFPLHCMLLTKTTSDLNQMIPWLFDIRYKDLLIPIFVDDFKIIGFNKFKKEENALLDPLSYYFIQTKNPKDINPVIEIKYLDGTKIEYSLDEENDLHRSYYYRSINKDSVAYIFKKTPLVSSSLRHPGSIFNSYGKIYKISDYDGAYSIKSISDDVTIVVAITSRD